MTSLFDRELTQMEREVRDLKTIHQRGLGTTQFYSATAQKTTSSSMSYVTFRASVAQGSPLPAAFVTAISLPEPIAVSSIIYGIAPTGDYVSVTPIVFTPGTVKCKVISSSQIEDIT